MLQYIGISKEAKNKVQNLENLFHNCNDQEVQEMVAEQIASERTNDRAIIYRDLDSLVGTIINNTILISYTIELQYIVATVADHYGKQGTIREKRVRIEPVLSPDMDTDFLGNKMEVKDRLTEGVFYGVTNW